MKISIVTAAYRSNLMPIVWESIKKQTFKNWEWIIVNDAQEEIRQWYKEFKKENPNINVWFVDIKKQKGRFGVYSRNVGAMLANYDRIIFLDDDNQWESEHLQSLVDLEKETGKVPYCWMHVIGKQPNSNYNRIKKTGFSKQGIDLGCILWRKDLFEKYGYFRDDSQVTFDWNEMARVYYGHGPHNFICTNNPSLIFYHKRY